MRTALAILAGMLATATLLLAALRCFPAAGVVGVWALLLLVGLIFERWRYKQLAGGRPGPDWQATGERFVDPETGKLVTVYFHPSTGERRYFAA